MDCDGVENLFINRQFDEALRGAKQILHVSMHDVQSKKTSSWTPKTFVLSFEDTDRSPHRIISRMCAIVIQCAVELSRHEEICIVENLYDLQREAVPFPLGKLWLQMNFQLGYIDVACSTITRALQNLLDSKTETQDLYALHYRELLALLLIETASKPKYDIHFYEHYIQAAPFSSDEKRALLAAISENNSERSPKQPPAHRHVPVDVPTVSHGEGSASPPTPSHPGPPDTPSPPERRATSGHDPHASNAPALKAAHAPPPLVTWLRALVSGWRRRVGMTQTIYGVILVLLALRFRSVLGLALKRIVQS